MEFTVSRNSLLLALQHTRQIINKKNFLHAFRNFVLTFRNDCQLVMTVHTSNGEAWMTEDVVLNGTKGELRPIGIYYSDLLPAIKALDEQSLRFVVGESQVTVFHEIGSFRLPIANNTDEFLAYKVPCPDVEAADCYTMTYEAPALASILSRCSYAMATDELRPVMNGVYINLTPTYSDYVTSDGHILVRVRKNPVRYSGNAVVTNFVIPAYIVKILQHVLPKTGDVDIDYQPELKGEKDAKTSLKRKAQCCITIDDNLTISFNPVDGRYPNYLSVIPEHNKYEMLIDRRTLTKSLDRLALFASTNNLIRMTINREQLRLNTSDTDFDIDGEETLPCECNLDTDKTIEIGLEVRRLSKTLKTMSTEKISIHVENRNRAIIINPQPHPDNEELTYLLMPMMYE
ncbi:MAG: hypothetical protein J6O49_10390 [Bacteroidaceae bacterium]|nr:hypothetical protein [Bacteroidaceae bacterium]